LLTQLELVLQLITQVEVAVEQQSQPLLLVQAEQAVVAMVVFKVLLV
jgi:hypothetical protein